jgi:hypothetical protein
MLCHACGFALSTSVTTPGLARASKTGGLLSFGTRIGAYCVFYLILVVLATVSGFVLGQKRLRWVVTLAAGVALAIFSAVVQQSLGFEAPIGIPVIVACLTLNQGAYVIGFLTGDGEGGLRSDTVPQQQPTNHQATDAVMMFVTNASGSQMMKVVARRGPVVCGCTQ